MNGRMAPFSLPALATAAARVGVVAGTLATFFLIRTEIPAWLLFSVALGSLGAVYVLEGRRGAFGAWALYLLGFAVFAYVRGLADETGIGASFDYVIALEHGLFAGGLPSLALQRELYDPGSVGLADGLAVAVYLSYFVVPHAVALFLWMCDRARFGRYALELLGVAYAGLAACLLVPTAPPWLAGQSGEVPFVHRVVEDVLNGVDPSLYQHGYELVGTNSVAAMPSLHMAMTAVAVVGLWRIRRGLGAAGGAYGVAMGLALVYTGEHYVVDVLAGLATAAASVAVTGAVLRARAARGDRAGATFRGRLAAGVRPQADRTG